MKKLLLCIGLVLPVMCWGQEYRFKDLDALGVEFDNEQLRAKSAKSAKSEKKVQHNTNKIRLMNQLLLADQETKAHHWAHHFHSPKKRCIRGLIDNDDKILTRKRLHGVLIDQECGKDFLKRNINDMEDFCIKTEEQQRDGRGITNYTLTANFTKEVYGFRVKDYEISIEDADGNRVQRGTPQGQQAFGRLEAEFKKEEEGEGYPLGKYNIGGDCTADIKYSVPIEKKWTGKKAEEDVELEEVVGIAAHFEQDKESQEIVLSTIYPVFHGEDSYARHRQEQKKENWALLRKRG